MFVFREVYLIYKKCLSWYKWTKSVEKLDIQLKDFQVNQNVVCGTAKQEMIKSKSHLITLAVLQWIGKEKTPVCINTSFNSSPVIFKW